MKKATNVTSRRHEDYKITEGEGDKRALRYRQRQRYSRHIEDYEPMN